jgi:RNA-binding protein Nova
MSQSDQQQQQSSTNTNSSTNNHISSGKRIGIKFLLSNSLTGSLIGSSGRVIKELIEVTDARINVSNPTDTYPGTPDRVILLSGTREAVSLAQTLIWEMIGLMAKGNWLHPSPSLSCSYYLSLSCCRFT